MPFKNKFFICESIVLLSGLVFVVNDIFIMSSRPDNHMSGWLLIVPSGGLCAVSLYHGAFEDSQVRRFGYALVKALWPVLFFYGLSLGLVGVMLGFYYAINQRFGLIVMIASWLAVFEIMRYLWTAINRRQPFKIGN